jgi:hypothetical protein
MLGGEELYWLGLFQLGRVINTQRLLLTTPHPTQRWIPSMPR